MENTCAITPETSNRRNLIRRTLDESRKTAKKFVRYPEGAERYSIGLTKFQALAKEAKAVYKVDGIALVNCDLFERYLETFREY